MEIQHVSSTGLGFSGVYLAPVQDNGLGRKSKEQAEQLKRDYISNGHRAITFPLCINDKKQIYLVVTDSDISIAKAIVSKKALYEKLVKDYQEVAQKINPKTTKVPDILLQKQILICEVLDELQRLSFVLHQKCPDLKRVFIETQ